MYLNPILRLLSALGTFTLGIVQNAGGSFLMFTEASKAIFRRPYRFNLIVKQMEFVGNKSVMIIVLIGFFTGMVFGLQTNIGFTNLGADYMAGSVVAMAMIRELGPILTAIMVAARAGSAITAELGMMRVTEQIDALESMAIDPTEYLVKPRLVAGAIVVPLLNGICILFGLLGGYIVNVFVLEVNPTLYIDSSMQYSTFTDIIHSMIKAFIFGMTVMITCCYYGMITRHGATGVSKATTKAVVESCVLVLVFDYIITTILVS